jgi:hypothetical protein
VEKKMAERIQFDKGKRAGRGVTTWFIFGGARKIGE